MTTSAPPGHGDSANDPTLGRCLATHRTSAGGYAALAGIMLASITVAAGLFALAWEADELGGRIVVSILALVCLLPALFGFYGLSRGRHNALRVFERGLIVHQAGADRRASWDEVQSYSDGAFLTIATRQGETLQFGMTGLRGGAEILSRLREEVGMRRRLPEMRSALARGEGLEFDGLDAAAVTPELAPGRSYVPGFLIDSSAIAPAGSTVSIPWGVAECGIVEGQAGSGRIRATVQFVLVGGPAGGYLTLLDTTSDRDLLVALCAELAAAARSSRG